MSARRAIRYEEPATAASRDWRSDVLSAVIVASVVFNFVLCFVNTNVFRTSAGLVIAAELALIATTLLLLIGRGFDLFVIIAAWVAYTIFLGALQGSFDPKPARDMMIPIVFYFAAREIGSREAGDRLVAACVWTVLAIGLYEYFFLKQFVKQFDILGYYVSRGTVQAAAAELSEDRLFASGMRYEGRTLLPFLGEHRVSSVFLEPVSVGNFGAICFAWIALRNWDRPLRMLVRLLPVVTIFVFADARFGLAVSLLSLLIYLVAKYTSRILVLIGPFALIVVLGWIGAVFPDVAWDNTLRGRILLSGQMISKLGFEDVFAFVRNDGFTSDSGYTYTMVKIGLVGFLGMWALFVLTPARDLASWRYRIFVAVYLSLLLIISNSVYSIKTAALLWYLVGALDAEPKEAAAEERIETPARRRYRPRLGAA